MIKTKYTSLTRTLSMSTGKEKEKMYTVYGSKKLFVRCDLLSAYFWNNLQNYNTLNLLLRIRIRCRGNPYTSTHKPFS
jgi:hypothetical protein